MALMKDYECYEEWKAEREAVRNTLLILDEDGNEIPDDAAEGSFNNVWAIRADDENAVSFVYNWHPAFDLLTRPYERVRNGTFMAVGHLYVFSSELDGWVDLTKMAPLVSELKERFDK